MCKLEIKCHCICGNPLEVEFDRVDNDIVLTIKPCSVCIENAMKELVWSVKRKDFVLFVPEHGDEVFE